MSINYKEKVWAESPQHVRNYYENKALYESLCLEVEYILKKGISDKGVEIANVSSRCKTLDSFCEKIYRKKYSEPFSQITDFSGARVVFLYEKDRQQLESLVESEFHVIEKVDKISIDNTDRFGYGALHYIVQLKNKHTGARYDELQNLKCEIQIRTILQDAWAIVAHHLSYKQESDVPPHLRRKLNALSGLFETADDQFESIREARVSYQSDVEQSILTNKDETLNQAIEVDNLEAYLKWKFPQRQADEQSELSEILSEVKSCGYYTLAELDLAIERTKDAFESLEGAHPPSDESGEESLYTRIGAVRGSLKFLHDDYIDRFGSELFSEMTRKNQQPYLHLVK